MENIYQHFHAINLCVRSANKTKQILKDGRRKRSQAKEGKTDLKAGESAQIGSIFDGDVAAVARALAVHVLGSSGRHVWIDVKPLNSIHWTRLDVSDARIGFSVRLTKAIAAISTLSD